MKPIDKLKEIKDLVFQTEDGDEFRIELLPGMEEKEVQEFINWLPQGNIPSEIKELLTFSRGFVFQPLFEVQFDAFNSFGFVDLFPDSIELAGDGAGNFWILDINSSGDWGAIYFVCHDPPVVVKCAESLTDFFDQVVEFSNNSRNSILGEIQETIVWEIWDQKIDLLHELSGNYKDHNLDAKELPESFFITNLESKPIKSGFAWGKTGPNPQIIRLKDKAIWLIEGL